MKNYRESTKCTSWKISYNRRKTRRKWRVTHKKERKKDRKCQKRLKARDTSRQGSTITLSDRFGRSERWTSSRYDKFLLVDPRHPARPGERKLGREGKKRERERGKKNRNRDHFENEIFKRWDGVNYRYVSSSGIADSVQIEPISRDLTHIFYLCSCSM